jgi:hypothetical protein
MTPGMRNVWQAAAAHRAGLDGAARESLQLAAKRPLSDYEPPGEPTYRSPDGDFETYSFPFSYDVSVDRTGDKLRIMQQTFPNLDVWVYADGDRRVTSVALVEMGSKRVNGFASNEDAYQYTLEDHG